MSIRIFTFLIAVLSLSLCGCHSGRSDYTLTGTTHPRYDITDIGPAQDLSINNKGQIIGDFIAGSVPNSTSYCSRQVPALIVHGFLWDNGERTEMRTFGGWCSEAEGITDQGQVLGEAAVPANPCDPHLTHKCFWDGTNLLDLEADTRFRTIPSGYTPGVIHIMATGAVYVISPPPATKGCLHLWLYPSGFRPGVGRDEGILGGSHIIVRAINDNGMIVGERDTGMSKAKRRPNHHAFMWWKGRMTDIGTFGGSNSDATALNNAGQVVGNADVNNAPIEDGGDPPSHAFLWKKGRMRDLGVLPGGDSSRATGINEKAQVIGTSNGPGRGFMSVHPVLWENNQIKDLTTLIPAHTNWTWLNQPTGINNKGQIVGDGDNQGSTGGPIIVIAGGAGNGYLLTPK